MLTLVELQESLPKQLQNSANQQLLDDINKSLDSPDHAEFFRNNVLTYSKIITEGKYKVSDYLSAVCFVTHKLCGCSDKEAYERTFPIRYKTFLQMGKTAKDISSSISLYKHNKMVTKLLEQSIIPLRIYNQDKRQQALDVCAKIIHDVDALNRDKIEAAKTILTHLADPEEKNESVVNVTVGSVNVIEQLNATMNKLAQESKSRIINGESSTVKEANVIAIEVDND